MALASLNLKHMHDPVCQTRNQVPMQSSSPPLLDPCVIWSVRNQIETFVKKALVVRACSSL
jgi:hypothetical protein